MSEREFGKSVARVFIVGVLLCSPGILRDVFTILRSDRHSGYAQRKLEQSRPKQTYEEISCLAGTQLMNETNESSLPSGTEPIKWIIFTGDEKNKRFAICFEDSQNPT